MKMKHIAAVATLVTAMSCPVLAGEEAPETSRQPYFPSVADIMGAIQLRHFKLWYAGNVKNWTLANYELGKINASCQDATRLYPNNPVTNMKSMAQPAEEIRGAIEAKDSVKFENAFKKLTLACNSCHEAAGVGFIDIRVPRTSPIMTSPLSDQWFAPK
jgi:cytochrome c556